MRSRLTRCLACLAHLATVILVLAPGHRSEAQAPPDGVRAPARAVPREHPYLLGSRDELKALAESRSKDYRRMVEVARDGDGDDFPRTLSRALVFAIDGDVELGKKAVRSALELVRGPVKKGHVPFGHDLALAALVHDLCHELWTGEERSLFCDWFGATVDANVDSETHVFHNGWYGYKNWGIGLAASSLYHEYDRAPAILAALEEDYRERAAPALHLAGAGGGFAEGYYIHYWLYEWLFFCEAARRCGGIDYHGLAPEFYESRAVASMFEMYPGIREYGSRRPVPMGDGGGRVFGGDRDKALFAREILAARRRDDPAHRAVRAFDETTPRSSVGVFAYMDFLWRDRSWRSRDPDGRRSGDGSVPAGDLASFRLSHLSEGPGHVYARSSWGEDATYFYFKCGDRFTAHQHLDVGHFVIFRHEELAGDGGHYDAFGSAHDVNYHLRTVAHSTILVLDPEETWPGIRAGRVTSNDGGQAHAWPHHNGAVVDAAEWERERDRALYDIADIVAFEDLGSFLYVAGDCTRAYGRRKLELFTRQIVFVRPGTFIVFDRVRATDPGFAKTWCLQAMKVPAEIPVPAAPPAPSALVVTNGGGRLFVRTLLPADARVRLVSGDDLYTVGGRSYPPSRDTGPAPECRIEVSPSVPSAFDAFLHVLTAADASVEEVPPARAAADRDGVTVEAAGARIRFALDRVSGTIEIGGARIPLATTVVRGD